MGPTVLANLGNQAVVVVSQLLVVPLLLSHWGLDGLGTWLLLMAVPTYLTVSDLGFTSSAKTDMSARVARGDLAEAKVTASSVAALLIVVLVVFGGVYLALVFSLDWQRLLNLPVLSSSDARLMLLAGLVQIAAYQAFLLAGAVIRAAGRPATEASLSGLFRAAETLALALAVTAGGGIVVAAAVWALTRLATTLAVWLVLAVHVPELVPAPRLVDRTRVRQLLRPSLGYMLLPLASAIIIQGSVLVLGVVASAAAVAAYSSIRVVTRVGVSAANTVSYSFTPQYTYSLGRGDIARLRMLRRSHVLILGAGTLLYLLAMILLGALLVRLLTRGAVEPNTEVLWLLALAAACEMAWSLPIALGSATNVVMALSVTYLGLAILCLGLTIALSPSLGPVGAAMALVVSQASMAILALTWLRRGDVSLGVKAVTSSV